MARWRPVDEPGQLVERQLAQGVHAKEGGGGGGGGASRSRHRGGLVPACRPPALVGRRGPPPGLPQGPARGRPSVPKAGMGPRRFLNRKRPDPAPTPARCPLPGRRAGRPPGGCTGSSTPAPPPRRRLLPDPVAPAAGGPGVELPVQPPGGRRILRPGTGHSQEGRSGPKTLAACLWCPTSVFCLLRTWDNLIMLHNMHGTLGGTPRRPQGLCAQQCY